MATNPPLEALVPLVKKSKLKTSLFEKDAVRPSQAPNKIAT